MWNLKHYANELIYKTETDSQASKTNLQLLKRTGEGEGGKLRVWDEQIQPIIYKISKVILHSTGNYSQYLVTNHSGKEHEK